MFRILRFRVISNTDETHYNDPLLFKGFYIDDVIIHGESLEESRTSSDQQSGEDLLFLSESETEGTIDVYEESYVSDVQTNVEIPEGDPVRLEIPVEGDHSTERATLPLWILLWIAPFMIAFFPLVVRKRYL